jgi:hypothetical protein
MNGAPLQSTRMAPPPPGRRAGVAAGRRIESMRRSLVTGLTLCLVAALAVGLGADMKSKQKTQVKFEGMLGKMMGMFGGKAMKEGLVGTVAISGDRMMTINDQTGELVDLAQEKVYAIDFKGKSYKVKTFAEIRKEWEDAKAKMKEQAAEAKEEPKEGEVQYEIDFKVERTGQRKTVNGYDCQEAIMTIAIRQKGKTLDEGGGMAITSDLWLAPKIPAMQEQIDFTQRYMKKLFGNDTETMARDLAQALAMYPQLKDGMERMKKEAVKLDGTPVLTTMKIETVMSPEQAKSQSEGGDKPKMGIGGIAGGLGGMFGKKKKAEEAPKDDAAAAGPKNRATFMTSTTELLDVQTSVAPGDVDIPAGFKQK